MRAEERDARAAAIMARVMSDEMLGAAASALSGDLSDLDCLAGPSRDGEAIEAWDAARHLARMGMRAAGLPVPGCLSSLTGTRLAATVSELLGHGGMREAIDVRDAAPSCPARVGLLAVAMCSAALEELEPGPVGACPDSIFGV